MSAEPDFSFMVSSPVEFRLPRGRRWIVGPRPAVMGILNVTPDSFSDGGRFADPGAAVREGLRMLADGAEVIDVGGESTRPGSQPVPVAEEIRRVLPVIGGLRERTDAPVSIDTRKPEVGEAALEAGADVVNDVSACEDPGWIDVLRRRDDVPVVLMHMRGTPQDMQRDTRYPDGVLVEIKSRLSRRMSELESVGISRDRFIVDPGIGFAKEAEHNLEILRGLPLLKELGRPILVGVSRKIFLGRVLARDGDDRGREPRERDVGTVAANAVALLRGASILRVHNVPFTRDLVDVFEALALGAGESLASRSGGG